MSAVVKTIRNNGNGDKLSPEVLTSIKIWAKKVTAFQDRTLRNDRNVTIKAINLIHSTKHSLGALRLYECSRSRAAVGQPENFKKNPAVAAAGP